jgi:hypothetical protein
MARQEACRPAGPDGQPGQGHQLDTEGGWPGGCSTVVLADATAPAGGVARWWPGDQLAWVRVSSAAWAERVAPASRTPTYSSTRSPRPTAPLCSAIPRPARWTNAPSSMRCSTTCVPVTRWSSGAWTGSGASHVTSPRRHRQDRSVVALTPARGCSNFQEGVKDGYAGTSTTPALDPDLGSGLRYVVYRTCLAPELVGFALQVQPSHTLIGTSRRYHRSQRYGCTNRFHNRQRCPDTRNRASMTLKYARPSSGCRAPHCGGVPPGSPTWT